jgi:hypothetical protein
MNELSPEGEDVMESDSGMISVALKMYADFIEKEGGSDILWQRVMDLHYGYKDMKTTDE